MPEHQLEEKTENRRTLLVTGFICLTCSLALSLITCALKPIQERSILIDKKKELLISARLLDDKGRYMQGKKKGQYATESEVLELIQARIRAMLIDKHNSLKTFQELGEQEQDYMVLGQKKGFHTLPRKLVYLLLSENSKTGQVEAFILPVQGKGLWGPIRGYLCLEADADTVRGATWHEHQETPGLGDFISDPKWQKQLIGKKIFPVQGDEEAPLGLYVVQGGVESKWNKSPKRFSAVDGRSGATLTGIGVTQAYQTTLAAYRMFLIKQRDQSK
ncbi:NADH:ubiquinone reductase (Na(+)-transporting) subunit C [Candidatus Similichlamydia laticola]|uniref:Na(+)-translocating NADH-quinone reductase subunit C n=1 Tax=Candidatus Similichlamydia laticola TaxID=2170265 RepID=A0A369KHX1_9BACT|nr:NADH:ubiquinone reductase (Na(+)-transporting) subunit C [Candidatus Similichlamydia laticola]RDB31364.1 Na(+)-translocating NADH-quinone reductase subunit C [Candidatus Similichlamydia laticola]